MSPEDIRIHINNALDMLQIITEDVEDNLVTSDIDNAVTARATMTISALYILSDYLRNIKDGMIDEPVKGCESNAAPAEK